MKSDKGTLSAVPNESSATEAGRGELRTLDKKLQNDGDRAFNGTSSNAR